MRWVNGRFAGYGTDSRLGSSTTSRSWWPGHNDLAIVVVVPAHSYVDDQDRWWMADCTVRCS
jgi:beta-galactosidase/beta-glucuronidase